MVNLNRSDNRTGPMLVIRIDVPPSFARGESASPGSTVGSTHATFLYFIFHLKTRFRELRRCVQSEQHGHSYQIQIDFIKCLKQLLRNCSEVRDSENCYSGEWQVDKQLDMVVKHKNRLLKLLSQRKKQLLDLLSLLLVLEWSYCYWINCCWCWIDDSTPVSETLTLALV